MQKSHKNSQPLTRSILFTPAKFDTDFCPFSALENNNSPFKHVMLAKKEIQRRFRHRLLQTPLQEVVSYWYEYHQPRFHQLAQEMLDLGIFPTKLSNGEVCPVAGFKYINHVNIINWIKKHPSWGDEKKEQVTTCYKMFATWLYKLSPEDFDKVLSLKRAFSQQTNFSEWRTFIECFGDHNKRDELICRMLLQGKQRVSAALNITIDKIDFEHKKIRFSSKKQPVEVFFEDSFMQELNEYFQSTATIRKTNPWVFITRTGNKLTRRRLNYSFAHVCKKCNIRPIKPDSVRQLWNEFKKDGYPDFVIMQSKTARLEASKNEWQKKMEDMLNNEHSK